MGLHVGGAWLNRGRDGAVYLRVKLDAAEGQAAGLGLFIRREGSGYVVHDDDRQPAGTVTAQDGPAFVLALDNYPAVRLTRNPQQEAGSRKPDFLAYRIDGEAESPADMLRDFLGPQGPARGPRVSTPMERTPRPSKAHREALAAEVRANRTERHGTAGAAGFIDDIPN